MHAGTIKWTISTLLVTAQLSCATFTKQPPSEDLRANLGRIGVATVDSTPAITLPETVTSVPRSAGVGQTTMEAGKGAIVGGLGGAVVGGLIGFLVGLAACAPAGLGAALCAGGMFIYGAAGGAGTGAIAGGTYMAAKAAPAVNEAEDTSVADRGQLLHGTMQAYFERRELPRDLTEQIAAAAERKAQRLLVVVPDDQIANLLSQPKALAAIDTLLEVKLEAVGMTVSETVSTPTAKVELSTSATLRQVADGKLLYRRDFTYASEARDIAEWCDDAAWQQFGVEAGPWLSEQIVDPLFVAPANGPVDWLAALKQPLQKAGGKLGTWIGYKPSADAERVESSDDTPVPAQLDDSPVTLR